MTETRTEIVNVVASTRLDRRLNLQKITGALQNSTYEPGNFPGLVYRRTGPKATVIMFTTGKVVSVGTRSEDDARLAILRTLQDLSHVLPGASVAETIRTENVVATARFGGALDLYETQLQFPDSSFEPDQFPAVILATQAGVTFLLFATGKVVCAGAKGEVQARTEIDLLFHQIRYRGLVARE